MVRIKIDDDIFDNLWVSKMTTHIKRTNIHTYIVSNIVEYQSQIYTLRKNGVFLCKNDASTIMNAETMEKKLLGVMPHNKWLLKFREIVERSKEYTIVDIALPLNENKINVTIGYDVSIERDKTYIGGSITISEKY